MGTGVEAERLFYSMGEKRKNIICVMDNYKRGNFHGFRICSINEAKKHFRKALILISSLKYYKEMKKQLLTMGLEEFVDFVKGGCVGKQIVYINANCYAQAYGRLLSSNYEFNERFYVYYDIPLCDQEPDVETIIHNCDVCLTQDVRNNSKYGKKVSLEWHKKNIRQGCRLFVVPNLVGFGKVIFPQCIDNDEKNSCAYDALPYGVFPFADAYVDAQVRLGNDKRQIINTIINGEPLSSYEILNGYKRTFEEFRKREESWDIKIIDYIEHNIKTSKVMLDLRHPSSDVLKRIVSDILLKLDCKNNDISIDYDMNQYEIPIYPQVARTLGLRFEDKVRSSLLLSEESRIDISTYIQQYLYWCFERNRL